ncbi:MAG: ABC transporter permease [Actinomycetota bacterium]|nr:ABC transporter permease [Actinomycetota bacterium]MDA3028603.1 ABC transporter permease [Actinomycetota bacterium]
MTQVDTNSGTGGASASPVPPGSVPSSRSDRAAEFLSRWGVLAAVILTIAAFSALRPEIFPTINNARSILSLSAPLLVATLGLTVVLVMQDFDLSFASQVGLTGAVAIVLMHSYGWPWPLATLVALILGVGCGLFNGLLVARLGFPSFISTLALGTLYLGVEFQITGQKTIFDDSDGSIADGYRQLAQSRPFWSIPMSVWVALTIALLLWILLEKTELGRYLYAIGGNREASTLSGLAVTRIRIMGFAIASLAFAIAGILLTAQSAASSPNRGAPLLLPAFAAAFIGSSVRRQGQFNITGTVVGVLFLQIVATGLTMLQLATSVVLMVQAGILLGAIGLSLIGNRAR